MQTNTNKKATRNDVAKLAGTSSAVVSYVVNNGPKKVSEKTKQKVLEAIKILGYRPNNLAKALVKGQNNIIGLIIPNIKNPFIASLAHSIEIAALEKNYTLLLGDSDDNPNLEDKLLDEFLNLQISALIFQSVKQKPNLELLKTANIPVAFINNIESNDISCVYIDETKAASKIVKKMILSGYKDIAIIAGPKEMQNSQDRIAGWKKAHLDNNLIPREDLIFYSNYNRVAGYNSALELFSSHKKFDAIFTTNEQQAFGVIKACFEKNINIPNDIGLTTFNATEISEYCAPPICAVVQPVDMMSEKLIECLISNSPQKVEIETAIRNGMSLRCQKEK